MRNILIFGNSGSGKSTLARQLCRAENLSHLDLDTLAWRPTTPPQRNPLDVSAVEISNFIDSNEGWIIEGCYVDLLEIAAPFSNEIVFMNLPVALCVENARKRPWEPHKYESRQAQDQNLNMLVNWIVQYENRTDTLSKAAHTRFYNDYPGRKKMITANE